MSSLFFVLVTIHIFFSIIHIFPWSGIMDENMELSNTLRIPDIKSGRMVRLLTQFAEAEEMMFKNMIKRLNTLAKVSFNLFYFTIKTKPYSHDLRCRDIFVLTAGRSLRKKTCKDTIYNDMIFTSALL